MAKYKDAVYQSGNLVYDQYTNELPEFSNYQGVNQWSQENGHAGRLPYMYPGEKDGYEVFRLGFFGTWECLIRISFTASLFSLGSHLREHKQFGHINSQFSVIKVQS